MRLLCGDIGGTKTELAVFEGEPGAERQVAATRVPSADYCSFEALLTGFDTDGAVDAAAFGVAGPVADGRCETTNLPWVLEAGALSARIGAPVSLVNDFHAMALGVGELAQAQLQPLQAGQRDPDGPITVLGAGTGFGCAHVVRVGDDGAVKVLATEAGHADFGPRDADDEALLRFARARTGGRVTVEHLVSGPGLALIYDFIVASGAHAERPGTATALAGLSAGDAAGVIGPRGVDGSDPACRAAVDRFVSLYGSEAGNVALRMLPTGGMYIAGGVAGRLRPRMETGGFREAMCAKPPMAGLVASIPVDLVLEPRTGLLGARAQARMLHLACRGSDR